MYSWRVPAIATVSARWAARNTSSPTMETGEGLRPHAGPTPPSGGPYHALAVVRDRDAPGSRTAELAWAPRSTMSLPGHRLMVSA